MTESVNGFMNTRVPRRIKFKTLPELLTNTNYIFSLGGMYSNPYMEGISSLPIRNTLDFNSPMYITKYDQYREFCLLMSELMNPHELIDLCGHEFTSEEFEWKHKNGWVEVKIRHDNETYDLYLESLDMFEVIK